MTAGWRCRVLTEAAEIELEQLDGSGEQWFAAGPGGEHIGGLTETLAAASGESSDPMWLAVAVTTIERDRASRRRSMLLVKCASGTWFHATLAENRASICAYGLDWRRMTNPGIAGSREPEADGVFLCADLDGAEWFAGIGERRGRAVDIWGVTLNRTWLVGDPGASGGGDDSWMICPEPISRRGLKLLRQARPSPSGTPVT